MKIALLLFGQLRTFDMCKWMIKNTLLDRYDCDVFMSIDKNNLHQHEDLNSKQETNDSMVLDAIDFIKPKDFYITDCFTFENEYNTLFITENCIHSCGFSREKLTITDFSNSDCLKFRQPFTKDINQVYSKRNKDFYTKIFRQYFVLNECYKMLNNYIDKNDVKYDLIIKLRYDQFFWTNDNSLHAICEKNVKNEIIYNETNKQIIQNNCRKVEIFMDNAEKNTIKVFGGGIFSNYGYVNDQFWTHGMDLINTISKFYRNLERLVNKTHQEFIPHSGCTPEHLFLLFLLENDVTIKRSNFSGIFVREFENRII